MVKAAAPPSWSSATGYGVAGSARAPTIVGSTMRMDGKPFTIVESRRRIWRCPGGAEYWRPLVFKPREVSYNARGAQWIGGIARLKPASISRQAKAAMAVVADRLSA